MNKWIIVLLVIGVGAFAAWKFVPRGAVEVSAGENFLADVPSDTIYYFGGKPSEDLVAFTRDYSAPVSSLDEQAFASMFEEMGDESEAPAKFALFFFEEYLNNASDLGGWLDSIGSELASPYAIYSHGAIPVFRANLADVEKFNSFIDRAVSSSGWQYSESSVGTASLKNWLISSEDDGEKIYLTLALNGKTSTLTITTSKDEDAMVKERLGLVKPADSLAKSGEIDQIKQQYAFSDDGVFFVNIARIVEGIYSPESNSLGKDLSRLLPHEAFSKIGSDLSDSCKNEYVEIAKIFPRFVAGYKNASYQDKTLSMSMSFAQEIKSPNTLGELVKLRGHVPKHTMIASDKILSLGMGVDIGTLPGVLTALWTELTNAQYSCDSLIEMQAQMKGQNPAMIGMMLGMVNGLKGIGVSLYDITLGDTLMPESASILLSVAADDPQVITSALQMAPMMQGISFPADGSETDIAIPMVPPSLKIKGAIKGNHIAVYTGEKATEEAAKLATETLESNGLYSLGLNYRNFSNLEKLLNFNIPGVVGSDCASKQELLHAFNMYQMDFTYIFDIAETGLVGEAFGSIDVIESGKGLKIGGQYKVESMDEDCQWYDDGVDTLNSDGSGAYIVKDESGACDLYHLEYQWQHNNNRLTMTPSNEKFRDSCEDPEQTETDMEEYVCTIINVTDNSFQCIFDIGTPDATVSRFSRS